MQHLERSESERTYFLSATGGKRDGPFTAEQIRRKVLDGQANEGDLVWRKGLSEWIAIRDVPEICDELPPPLPAPSRPVPAIVPTAVPPVPAASARTPSPYAGFGRRAAAFLIDYIILFVLSFIASFLMMLLWVTLDPSIVESNPGKVQGAGTATSVGLALIYWLGFESSSWSATPGKKALGIVVARGDGLPVTIGTAGLRFVGKLVTGVTLGLGFLLCLFTKKKQCLHDLIAGSVVLHTGFARPADPLLAPDGGQRR